MLSGRRRLLKGTDGRLLLFLFSSPSAEGFVYCFGSHVTAGWWCLIFQPDFFLLFTLIRLLLLLQSRVTESGFLLLFCYNLLQQKTSGKKGERERRRCFAGVQVVAPLPSVSTFFMVFVTPNRSNRIYILDLLTLVPHKVFDIRFVKNSEIIGLDYNFTHLLTLVPHQISFKYYLLILVYH